MIDGQDLPLNGIRAGDIEAFPVCRPWLLDCSVLASTANSLDCRSIAYVELQIRGSWRRTKSWSKSLVPSSREAQRLAYQFMEPVNERNNQPHLF